MAKKKTEKSGIRNRVKEMKMVKVKDLKPNENNWRYHEEDQKEALRGVLESVGIAGALVAYERVTGKGKTKQKELVILDGHLRQEQLEDEQEVPVVILDVNDAEAKVILATHDTIGMMAEVDEDQLSELLRSMSTDLPDANFDMDELSNGILESIGIYEQDDSPPPPADGKKKEDNKQQSAILAVTFASPEEKLTVMKSFGFSGKELDKRKIDGLEMLKQIEGHFAVEKED